MPLFKAIIRVVKSKVEKNIETGYGIVDVIWEPLIDAKDKQHVKEILAEKYPQFFPAGKVYEKETKQPNQFFYVVIFPLYKFEVKLIEQGEWACAYCGQIHENKYVSKPVKNERLFGDNVYFCSSPDNICLTGYKQQKYKDIELTDDEHYIKKDSPNYIYKCTEKATGKCYIGKTRNEPFFRWWNHLKHNQSPFGVYLRQTKLSDWQFEVLEELPSDALPSEILKIESMYISKFDSINNGFNQVISNKNVAYRNEILFTD